MSKESEGGLINYAADKGAGQLGEILRGANQSLVASQAAMRGVDAQSQATVAQLQTNADAAVSALQVKE